MVVQGSAKDATMIEKAIGERLAEKLRTMIQPYLLRREKKNIFKYSNNDSIKEEADDLNPANSKYSLDRLESKTEMVVWIELDDSQKNLYEKYLATSEVKNVLNKKTYAAFSSISFLKKLCDHPALLNLNDFSFNEG
jgi:SNF2 family DNA or RNA helicase